MLQLGILIAQHSEVSWPSFCDRDWKTRARETSHDLQVGNRVFEELKF